jgi:hypothetical protein
MISSEQLQKLGKELSPEQAWDVFIKALDHFAVTPDLHHYSLTCDAAKVFAASSCWVTLETIRKATEDGQSSTS